MRPYLNTVLRASVITVFTCIVHDLFLRVYLIDVPLLHAATMQEKMQSRKYRVLIHYVNLIDVNFCCESDLIMSGDVSHCMAAEACNLTRWLAPP